jgi:hypothetical protein
LLTSFHTTNASGQRSPLIPPFENAKSAKRVPATWSPFRLELKEHFSGVRILQPPPAIRRSACLDKFDGVDQARIARRVDRPEVVEGSQDVIVPPRRKREEASESTIPVTQVSPVPCRFADARRRAPEHQSRRAAFASEWRDFLAAANQSMTAL